MKIAALIARILLGLMFLTFGLNGFLQFIPMPPPTGMAATFLGVLAASHYTYFLFGVQILAAVLLLSNQFVPLALVLLGAVIANILVFHLTMNPAGIGLGLVALVLWIILASRYGALFRGVLARS